MCGARGAPTARRPGLPTFTSAEGLPIGSQLIAGPWDEAALIRVAAELEDLDRWPHRRPARYAG
ncbi:hypothetical protein AB0N06_35185 [Streptomyces sp. NPDC051020]|uniref:hypothetical protein n=1 Tax=Streptomyces sp. NPDC051020 TaxID=3155409 RepID=UPI0034161A84